MDVAGKKLTVESSGSDEEKDFDDLVKTIKGVLASSVTRKFREKTLRDAGVIILRAASMPSSFHGARKRMKTGTSRRQAVKPLENLNLRLVMRAVNLKLCRRTKKKFGGRCIRLSLDLHEIPYHGKAFADENEVRGGKQKDGTRHFHGFATVYATVKRKRYTLAIMFVPNHTSMRAAVRKLLSLVARTGVGVERLLLDKGFYAVDVIRLLKRLNLSFIMPMKGNRLEKKRGSYQTTYMIKTAGRGRKRQETVRAYSVIKYDRGKRFGKHGSRQLCYISWGVRMPPRKIADEYRKRFGIESSYKLSKKSRPRTSTRNPAYRAMLLAASFLLQNAWVDVKQKFCSRTPRWSREFITLRDFMDAMLAIGREFYGELTSFVLKT